MAAERLSLSATTQLEIVESSDKRLEVEATYEPNSAPPPNHFHPAQDETFEVLQGAMQVSIDGEEPRSFEPGETLRIPRGTPHLMWNAGAEEARLRWVTEPGGRTEEFFRGLDSLYRRSQNETVEPEEYIGHLDEYKDVFRIVLKEETE